VQEEVYTKGETMKIKLLNHDNVIVKVLEFDERTKVATVKIFGSLVKFRKDEYEVVK